MLGRHGEPREAELAGFPIEGEQPFMPVPTGDPQPAEEQHKSHPWPRGLTFAAVATLAAVVAAAPAVTWLKGPWRTASSSSDISGVALRSVSLARQPVLELPRLRPKMAWFNRGSSGRPRPNMNLSRAAVAKALRQVPTRRLSRKSCAANIDRLDKIDQQRMSEPPDPLFPASAISIAEPGADCGDSVAWVHKPCSMYDKWKTFEDVAKGQDIEFSVFGPRGVQYSDVNQGSLGTTYFLSALASVAYSEPQKIKDMFVDQDLWGKGIFVTKWLVNGKESRVEVDNMIPANPDRNDKPFFANPKNGAFWPVILEKAWSKIFTSFRAAEGGNWDDVVGALTQAPTKLLSHVDVSVDELWDSIMDGTTRKLPMGCSASSSEGTPRAYGLAEGHAYSLLRAFTDADYGRVVEIYNPWNSDYIYYEGDIPNDDNEVFRMTMAEFYDSFSTTHVAEFRPNYSVSFKTVQHDSQNKASVHKIEVHHKQEFWVSLSWPNARMVEPCDMKAPTVILAVSKVSESSVEGEPVLGKSLGSANAVGAKVALGRGKYVVLASAHFPGGDLIRQLVLTVYSKAKVDIVDTDMPAPDVGLAMFGPGGGGAKCSAVMIRRHGLFVANYEKDVGGLPTYWSFDNTTLAYFRGGQSQWFVAPREHWQNVRSGENWYLEKLNRSSVACGCHDSENGVGGFGGVSCSEVKSPTNTWRNVECATGDYPELVTRYCPVTCGAMACSSDSRHKVEVRFLGTELQSNTSTTLAKQSCVDHPRTGIKLKEDSAEEATCEVLRSYCQMDELVAEKCCASCVAETEEKGLANGGCADDPNFMFTIVSSVEVNMAEETVSREQFNCSAAAGYCDRASIREHCCGTCKPREELWDECIDDPPESGPSCERVRDQCSHSTSVRETCCKTCLIRNITNRLDELANTTASITNRLNELKATAEVN